MKYGHHKDCSAGSFICKNVRQCISSELRCDLKPDCIDGTDEQDCSCKDYFSVHAPDRLCDGYPDCYDFSDELGCNRCNGSSTFYCHLSKTCIDKSQVCDEKNDCHFQEDERYCMALTKNDQLNMDVSGKPYVHSQGYIAVNYKGNWRFICVGQWHSNTSDTICKYLGYVSSNNYQLTSNTVYPHLQLGHLPIDHVPHRMYRRSPDSEEVKNNVFFLYSFQMFFIGLGSLDFRSSSVVPICQFVMQISTDMRPAAFVLFDGSRNAYFWTWRDTMESGNLC